MLILSELTHNNIVELTNYCNDAKKAGFTNNSSLDLLKFGVQSDLESIPKFWGIYYEGKIISISGSHVITVDNKKYIRTLYRAGTLPNYEYLIGNAISKTHMNSMPFSIMQPNMIYDGVQNGYNDFIITTNKSSPDYKMQRTHKVMSILTTIGMTTYVGDYELFYTSQSVWKLNLNRYYDALVAFHNRRMSLEVTDTTSVYDIIYKNGFNCKILE